MKPQKALPISVFREMLKIKATEADLACGQLSTGALFYAMRSCEYIKVSGLERRTKKIRLEDIRFFQGNQELSHEDHDLRFLAETVSITFRFQKTDERDETITQHRTGDGTLCPAIQWADIVQRVLSYKDTSSKSPVCTIQENGELRLVTSKELLTKL